MDTRGSSIKHDRRVIYVLLGTPAQFVIRFVFAKRKKKRKKSKGRNASGIMSESVRANTRPRRVRIPCVLPKRTLRLTEIRTVKRNENTHGTKFRIFPGKISTRRFTAREFPLRSPPAARHRRHYYQCREQAVFHLNFWYGVSSLKS